MTRPEKRFIRQPNSRKRANISRHVVPWIVDVILLVLVISLARNVEAQPSPSPGYPPCNVCGVPGEIVTKVNATVTFPGQSSVTCAVLQKGALSGFVNPMYCPIFASFNITNICGCAVVLTVAPTIFPTMRPGMKTLNKTLKPTYEPLTRTPSEGSTAFPKLPVTAANIMLPSGTPAPSMTSNATSGAASANVSFYGHSMLPTISPVRTIASNRSNSTLIQSIFTTLAPSGAVPAVPAPSSATPTTKGPTKHKRRNPRSPTTKGTTKRPTTKGITTRSPTINSTTTRRPITTSTNTKSPTTKGTATKNPTIDTPATKSLITKAATKNPITKSTATKTPITSGTSLRPTSQSPNPSVGQGVAVNPNATRLGTSMAPFIALSNSPTTAPTTAKKNQSGQRQPGVKKPSTKVLKGRSTVRPPRVA